MRALQITDAETMVLVLQDEIRRNEQARYDHRLHGVLLVAQGMSCRQAALLLGDAPRTLENWVNDFEQDGLCALTDYPGRGRKAKLSEEQLLEVGSWLRAKPQARGMEGNLWDGPKLSACLHKHYGIELGKRQCQRLFRQLNFRYRLPRPEVAKSDPQRQAAHKKTRRPGIRSKH
jgi:transposase